MVARREVPAPTVDLRAEFCAEQVGAHAEYCEAIGTDMPNRRLSALISGEAVEVAGWEVAHWFVRPLPFAPADRLRLEGDGTLVVLGQLLTRVGQ